MSEIPFERRYEIAEKLACGCIPMRRLRNDVVETQPSPDPQQAMLEAGLREARGFELVRDPLGRIA
jgi:hypothetical protein